MLQTIQVLAEPHRFQIVELLLAGPRSVGEIESKLRLKQPQASKHLKILREAGLVDVQPLAQQRLYGLRAEPMRQLHDWIERYRSLWDARFDALEVLVKEMNRKGRPKKRSK